MPRSETPMKRRYTTYLFPRHLSALEEIAKLSGKSVTRVLTEVLDTYLSEIGAIESPETTSPSKGALRAWLQRSRTRKGTV